MRTINLWKGDRYISTTVSQDLTHAILKTMDYYEYHGEKVDFNEMNGEWGEGNPKYRHLNSLQGG
jgi:hypothetical protein